MRDIKLENAETREKFEDLPMILTKKDLECILPYSPSYVSKLLSQGKLPSRKLGKKHVIFRKDFITWLRCL
jgi:hypothetical protein